MSLLSSVFSGASALVSDRGANAKTGIPYGIYTRQKFDLYEPVAETRTDATLIFFYGGSWRAGRRSYYAFVGNAFAANGIRTAIPDYRLYPDVAYPVFMEDAASAVRVVFERSTEKTSIILAGHSAGAHMAALLAYSPQWLSDAERSRIAAFVGLSGPYAFQPTVWHSTKAIFAAADDPDEPRPVAHVKPGACPALLFHGSSDRLVKPWNTEQMSAALRSAGTDVQQTHIAGMGHMGPLLALARPLRWRAPVLQGSLDFIAKITDQAAAAHSSVL